MRILIAEDDRTSADFLLKVLKGMGTCDIAINGIEAVDAFILANEENAPYDLLCLDLMMPIFDGEKVLRTVRKIENERKLERRVKVIITSALKDAKLKSRLDEYGFDAYVTKPIDAGLFLEAVNKL